MKKKRNRKPNKEITQKLLKEYLHYNRDTGDLTWCRKRTNGVQVGDVAGGVKFDKHGAARIVIGLLGGYHKAHRLAWLYMTGEWPKNEIDHEDGDGTNNRWENLRDVPRIINQRNKKCNKRNASGQMGVYWVARCKKWRVIIKANGKRIELGYYEDYDEAVLIRKQAEEYYGYHENHGRV